MEIKKLQSDRKRTIEIPVSNDTGETETISLAFWHKPVTPRLDEELTEIRQKIIGAQVAGEDEEIETKDVLVAQLAHILTRWEITDGGSMVSITVETLSGFEIEFLVAIRNAIYEPLYPKKTT